MSVLEEITGADILEQDQELVDDDVQAEPGQTINEEDQDNHDSSLEAKLKAAEEKLANCFGQL